MNMGYMIIDGQKVKIEGEKNILELIRKANIDLPTFCYYSELSVYGACRMCIVEDKWGGVTASCSTPPKDGMEIKTNTPKLQKHRKMILELLLSTHCRDCTTCAKTGKCRLQELAFRFGIKTIRFDNSKEAKPLDTSSIALVRDPNKCILCGDCVRVCQEKQGLGVLDFAYRGFEMQVVPGFNQNLAETNCVNCGQCAAVCPTGAITVKDQTQTMWEAICDERKKVVVQIAPAVRVALGEEFGIPSGENVFGKIVAALKLMGVDEVFDTALGADLTVMEEAKEFAERFKKGENLPQYTSCCPAWIKYAQEKHPELINTAISSCRSPMQMFASVIKEYHKKSGSDKELVSVAIMPCTAKKYEAARDEFKVNGVPNVDLVLTTQELATMIRGAGIRFDNIEEIDADIPFDLGSGAGVIFGVTGGVTEAVLRRCMEDKSHEALRELAFVGVRGKDGIKEAQLEVGGKTLRACVVHGLKNAEHVIQGIQSGQLHYDIIEVMACPEGCIGGAGQPFAMHPERDKRAKGLYHTDKAMQIKHSDKNPVLASVYSNIICGKQHEMLHVKYNK
ncbi:MAG: [FeFe] hydrogenase, group A [Clostridia bacterium]|nr:[FeFe] hydrogenase, group A [Clostridia bacterium]